MNVKLACAFVIALSMLAWVAYMVGKNWREKP